MDEHNGGQGRGGFATHLGFILVAAGCSIGLGNVWRFPYITGQSGGAVFCLIYLLFLLLLGLPLVTVELAIGRASRVSATRSFQVLAPGVRRWNVIGFIALVGKYVLLSFYSVITGWLLFYAGRMLQGEMSGLSEDGVSRQFASLLASPSDQFFAMLAVLLPTCLVCYRGVSRGVERFTKPVMVGMFLLVFLLAGYALTLDGASKGLEFYLMPSLDAVSKVGFWHVVNDAMNQVFFSLSIGVGCISIFGSYIGRRHSLLKDAAVIVGLDTAVALLSGLVIFPLCFTYGVSPDCGPTLIFQTLLNLFSQMPGGRIFGTLFFIFLTIAALTTLLAVVEGIVADNIDAFGMKRGKATALTFVLLVLLGIPVILGFNLWSGFHPLGGSSGIMDLMDFLISDNLLPLGALLMVLFTVSRKGWNWKGYVEEMTADRPEGTTDLNSPRLRFLRIYYTWGLTSLIGVILVMGYISKFLL